MYRVGPGGCPGTWESDNEGGVRDEDLRKYLKGAHGVEQLIGPRVWLGTIQGWARALGSTEVVIPSIPAFNRHAFIVLRLPKGFNALPEGTLTAIQLRRIGAPEGMLLPVGADLWFLTSNLAFTMEHCGKPKPS